MLDNEAVFHLIERKIAHKNKQQKKDYFWTLTIFFLGPRSIKI